MKRILITGACGYIGRQLLEYFNSQPDTEVWGVDIRVSAELSAQVTQMDIRSNELSSLVGQKKITHIAHLASVLDPGKDDKLDYDIDVNGTANVLNACADNGVEHLTVTSSGAAYGYHPDNPEWINEQDPLRGNEDFSYSRHKRIVEEQLRSFAENHKTKVLVLRPCTVLGAHTKNKITALFQRTRLLAVGNADSPFVFIWDQDVVNALALGITQGIDGAFNLAGDGKLTVDDLARMTGKSVQRIPASLIKVLLWLGKTLGLSHTGPEQVKFLQYRPVLSNKKLKDEFGYCPAKSSKQVFEYYWQSNAK